MEYNPPFGSPDPNAGYVDRNTPGAAAGSRVPAIAIEMPQREIVTVIKNAGLTPIKTDPTQLDQAIDLKIAAATGGGGDENYVLMTQARVRLPIFPEVETADGKLPVYSPANGSIRIPAGYYFVHRGIYQVTTVEQDFSTVANKTYHLRWSPGDGFALKDVADPAYNAGALPETHAAFDTVFDDMLVSRVVTNASNVATVTNLVNKDRLAFTDEVSFSAASYAWQENTPPSGITSGLARDINFARTPMAALSGGNDLPFNNNAGGTIMECNMGVRVISRYRLLPYYQVTGSLPVNGLISYIAIA
ncbi:MAG: hypothetical protein KJ947_11560 [Alphaproteobacteria bacterium]|nr:hypothetical protein [Alphaproteobacteria bacterium]MBU1550193.1 hypothetical protein [Alphaproteobacteria bacterium]MBU2337886.1 hypothetical protein [Alphaproteobacteria bacterium]MBU2387866.1 hypothetical protein [Alphaproteobacteria bacterium]